MKRLPLLLASLATAIVLCGPAVSPACCFSSWWGAYRPTYAAGYAPYTAGYASAYTAGYAPSYSTYYAPSYYSAADLTSTSYYGSVGVGSSSSCCDTGCCGQQTSFSVPSNCCSPCTSCGPNCTNCALGDCGLVDSSNSDPTPVTPRPDSGGSIRQTPTFIEEEDRGTGSQYDPIPMNPMNPSKSGTDDGFSPRRPDDSTDPLDRPFGTSSVSLPNTLQFKVPETIIDRREPAPTHHPEANPTSQPKDVEEPKLPLLNLDEKITSRSVAQRTRLVQRRSWEQPVIANTVSRQAPEVNYGWVPVPAPTQLVQK